jgi:hypothetical protein
MNKVSEIYVEIILALKEDKGSLILQCKEQLSCLLAREGITNYKTVETFGTEAGEKIMIQAFFDPEQQGDDNESP